MQKTEPFSGMEITEIIACDAIQQRVQAAVEHANAQLARYENIRTYKILEREFTIDSGEMTPTMKLKRKVIEQNHADVIEEFYAETAAESA